MQVLSCSIPTTGSAISCWELSTISDLAPSKYLWRLATDPSTPSKERSHRIEDCAHTATDWTFTPELEPLGMPKSEAPALLTRGIPLPEVRIDCCDCDLGLSTRGVSSCSIELQYPVHARSKGLAGAQRYSQLCLCNFSYFSNNISGRHCITSRA